MEWHPETFEVKRKVSVSELVGKASTIFSLLIVDTAIWCALGNKVVVWDMESGKERGVLQAAAGHNLVKGKHHEVRNQESGGVVCEPTCR